MENEEWLPIPGYEGYYEVSNLGRVRRCPQIMSPGKGARGHLSVFLTKSDDPMLKERTHRVHQLVLKAFVGPRPEGKWGLHKDGNPANNCVDNLYWGTPKENAQDAIRHGTHPAVRKERGECGHPLDGIRRNPDGSVRQRYCVTCRNEQSKEWKRTHYAPVEMPYGRRRLTDNDYKAIRNDDRPLRVIATEYGISHTTVRRIKRGASD